MKKRVATFLLIMLFVFLPTGCGGKKSVEKDGVNLSYSTSAKKSVSLPDIYPKDKFPIYKDSFVSAVQVDGKNLVVACFSKDKVEKVTEFYQDLVKNAQVITNSQTEDAYMSMGVKDGFTYSIMVEKNEGSELKDYITLFAITLMPAEPGMAESLSQFPGALPTDMGGGEKSGSNDQNEGDYSVALGVSLPQGYPQDVLPIYGGSTTSIEAAMSANNKGMVGYQTKKEPQQVLDFYRDELGGEDDFKEVKYGKSIVLTASKDGYNLRVMLKENEAATGIDPSYKTLVQMEYTKVN